MKVFIENEAGSNQKNLYNEKTLEYRKTVTVSREYPYPYGFILDTISGDGDNLDCFITTDAKLETGQVCMSVSRLVSWSSLSQLGRQRRGMSLRMITIYWPVSMRNPSK